MVRNVLAREKVLYEGHAVAAVAATSTAIAKRALKLIDVKYEVLPHVIDVVEAMQPDAPLLHDDLFTVGVEPKPDKPSNVAKRIEIVAWATSRPASPRRTSSSSASSRPRPCTRATSSRTPRSPACRRTARPRCGARRRATSSCAPTARGSSAWTSARSASPPPRSAAASAARRSSTSSRSAVALSKKAKRPVKMVMSREDVFKASGPTSGADVKVKMGATKDGKFVAGFAELKYQAGAFPGSPVQPGVMCALRAVRHRERQGHRLRRRLEPAEGRGLPRARRADLGVRRRERGGRDRQEARASTRWSSGSRTRRGRAPRPPTARSSGRIGLDGDAPRRREDRTTTPRRSEKWQGRGVASGFWFNIGGETCVVAHGERGRHGVAHGRHARHRRPARLARHGRRRRARHPLRQGAADHRRHRLARLQLPHRRQPLHLLGHAWPSWKRRSRSRPSSAGAPPSSGRCHAGAGRVRGRPSCSRSAALADGKAKPMSVADFAKVAGKTGGPIGGYGRINAQGAGPSFGTHLVDVEVDPETGHVTILRYTVAQDAGKARPSRATSRARSRAAPCRASAGRSTRSTSTTPTASCRTPASSTTACRWRPTCR